MEWTSDVHRNDRILVRSLKTARVAGGRYIIVSGFLFLPPPGVPGGERERDPRNKVVNIPRTIEQRY